LDLTTVQVRGASLVTSKIDRNCVAKNDEKTSWETPEKIIYITFYNIPENKKQHSFALTP
jgi:hypothetical protein